LRGILACRLDRFVELLCRGIGEPAGRTFEDSFQLLDLAALDVGERGLDPACRLCLLALDALADVPLTHSEALPDLVQRAPALDRMRLELGVGRRCSLLGRPRQLLA
jgi:hypothetical protein